MDRIERKGGTAVAEEDDLPAVSDWVAMGASAGAVIAMSITIVLIFQAIV